MAQRHLVRLRGWQWFPLCIGLVAGAVQAQNLPDRSKVIATFQEHEQANEKAQRQYAWQCRTEVCIKEELKSALLERVRYGHDGSLQKTLIENQSPKSQKNWVFPDNLKKLIESYTSLTPDRIAGLMKDASFQPGKDDMKNNIHVIMSNVVKRGDTISLWINKWSLQKTKMEILTSLDGDTVRMVYRVVYIIHGSHFTALSTVEIKAKGLCMMAENFDFIREDKSQ